MLVPRPDVESAVRAALVGSPVVALLGPRQCGKTTLARAIAPAPATYFDLEDPIDRARLESPFLALQSLEGIVVIDEVQRRPDLFEILRVLADRPSQPARFLVLGSASPFLVRGVSESLAGRVRFVDLGGFDLREVGAERWQTLWVRGSFPRAFLAETEPQSMGWRTDFIRTFLERDIPQLGIGIPAPALRRFWTMVAHYHGQVWKASEFARSLGTSEPTARRYLDILSGSFVVRQLSPWFENIGKRQVKAPKIYVRDSGLLHALLGLGTFQDVLGHPKLGASWEGFAIEQILSLAKPRDAYFWATHAGAELDLLIFQGALRVGVECKFADAPRLTRSMHVALETLDLERLLVAYPGDRSYRLHPQVEVVAIRDLPGALSAF